MTTPKPKPSAKPKAKVNLKFRVRGAKQKTATPQYRTTKAIAVKGKPAAELPITSKAKPPVPLTDDELGLVPGIPTDAEIEQRVGTLAPPGRAVFKRIRQLVAQHLGSFAAARLWLVTAG